MAGKKIQGGQLVFQVGDDGTLKLLEKKTKGAKKGMDDLGKASQATDRRIKGVTQQSSNATKNFSKQAQTMQGGIVAVYATIAAQVFAVSAAFQFLKDSMETRNLIQGQLAFGATTGVAYATMTKDIQAATSGMIQFKEAAQAAAIGTAAGLSAGQMEAIGTAAKNTSLALGRDLTDSFQRLTRGITKAEPELLDELGIILRLEPAMKAYANQIGKNAKDLTQFEKSQAVANEVLGQAESKFGAITQVLDPSAFALSQFAKAFDDMMKGVKEVVGDIAAAVLPFFSKNIYALVGALTLFLTPILKSILPDFAAMGAAAQDNFGKAAQAADDAAAASQRAKSALSAAGGGSPDALRDKDYMKKHKITAGKGMPEGQLSKRQLQIRKKHLKAGVGFSKNMNKQELRAYKKFLVDQEIALAASQGKKQGYIKRGQLMAKSAYASTTAFYKRQQMLMVSITQKASMMMNKAMRYMGWIGIALMIFEAVKALWDWIAGVDAAAEAEEKLTGDIKDRYQGLAIEIGKMNDVANKGLLNWKGTIEQMGSAFQSVDLAKSMKDYEAALSMKDSENRAESIAEIIKPLKALAELTEEPEALLKLIETMQSGGIITEDQVKNVTKLTAQFGNASMASKQFAENNKAVINSLRQMAGSGTKLFGSSVIENMTKNVESRRQSLELAPAATKRADDNVTRTKKELETGEKSLLKYNSNTKTKETWDAEKLGKMKADYDSKNMFFYKDREKFQDQWGMNPATARGWFKEMSKNLEINEKLTQERDNALQVQKETKAGITKEKKELKAEELILSNMTALQLRSSNLQKEQLQNKIDAVGVGKGTTVEDKNAKLELQNTAALTEEKDKLLKYDMALEALRVAKETDTATEEDLKSLQLVVDLAEKEKTLATKKKDDIKETTDLQSYLNQEMHDQLKLSEEHAANTKARALSEKQNAAAIRLATTHDEVRVLQEEKISRLQLKQTDEKEKIKELEDDLTAYRKIKGFDEEEARKRQVAINALKDQELITEQMITDEMNKQAGVDRMAARARKINSKQMQVQNMTGGGLPGFGIGNITPQAQALNAILLEEQTTLAALQADQTDKGKEHLATILKQADAQAKVGIELELANKTSSIMKQGFDSLFQALLDGTQSFGDAMKGVMKQVLADLAAAYMSAAAMTALRAIGLPGLPARYGGIMSPSGKSFGYGGVASGPESGYNAVLHGTEAVVPLGNDKSIPVKMSGPQGGNTVNVAISMEGGQSNTSVQGDQQMQGLGRAI